MAKASITIVFDWDGVVFDSSLMRQVITRALKKTGYQEDVAKETLHASSLGAAGYSPLRHGKSLKHLKLHDPGEISKIIYRAIERHPGDFVFPDAKRLLSELKREKYYIDILTSGDPEYQEYKIIRSKLRKIFRNVHIVNSGERVQGYKVQVLKKLSKAHGQLIFLDDRLQNIDAAYRSPGLKGKVLPVLVWRKKEKPPAGLPVVRRLSWKAIEKIAIHNGFQP